MQSCLFLWQKDPHSYCGMNGCEFYNRRRKPDNSISDFFKMKRTQFSSVECNKTMYTIEARHGAWLSPFSEKVKIKVSATGRDSCQVVIESSSRSILNILNLGANSGNVSDLCDCINNVVHNRVRIVSDGDADDSSTIRLRKPEIRFTNGYKPHDD